MINTLHAVTPQQVVGASPLDGDREWEPTPYEPPSHQPSRPEPSWPAQTPFNNPDIAPLWPQDLPDRDDRETELPGREKRPVR